MISRDLDITIYRYNDKLMTISRYIDITRLKNHKKVRLKLDNIAELV